MFIVLIGGNGVPGVYVHVSKLNQIVHLKWAIYCMSILLHKAVNKQWIYFYAFKIWHVKQRANNELIIENTAHPWVKSKQIPKYQDLAQDFHTVPSPGLAD